MKKDQMARALAALMLSLGLLLGLELLWKRWAFLSDNFKNTSFWGEAAGEDEAEESGEVLVDGMEKPPLTPPPSHTTRVDVRRLFSELEHGKRKKLRIAWYADSITEGDVVTDTLRRDLQGLYGGVGVGFQGVAPRDAGFRSTLKLRPSKDWKRADIHAFHKDKSIVLGFHGEAYHLDGESPDGGLRLERPDKDGSRPWYQVATLFWGKGDIGLDLGSAHYDLKGPSVLNAWPLPLSPAARLDLKISADKGVWIYGVSLDSPRGVQLDNFSLRGNAGDSLVDLSPGMLQAAQAALGYDLVVLQFGINALNAGEKDFHWYRAAMRKSFEHFKKNLPGAKIVVLSVMDHAEKKNGAIVSDPSLPYVLAAQSAAAADAGLWFINLYSLMGGAGVMKAWVEAPEALANKDYTHPNRRGGTRLARVIRAALLGEPNPVFPAPGDAHAP